MNTPPLLKSPLQRRPLAAYRLRRAIAGFRRERDAASRKAEACLATGRGFAADLHDYDAWDADNKAADAFIQLVPLMNPGIARLWKALA